MNIQSFLQQYQHKHIIVGLSGGVDSVVLLHLLAQARSSYAIQLSAIHIHHGLSVYADDWANFCAEICRDWHIPLSIEKVQVQAQGLGVEAGARKARYEAYARLDGDCIALAHHQDDQVETFFLASLRGSGLRGLVAMEYANQHRIVRPLLSYSRQQIEQYAQQHQLRHITDDSNHNADFLRNWVRHHWLPPLREHLPHADRHILSAITNLQDELSVLNEINNLDWQTVHPHHYLDIGKWQTLSPARKRQQLLKFVKHHGLGTPRRASVVDFERVLCDGAISAQWDLPQGKAVVYRGGLFALARDWERDWVWQHGISGQLGAISGECGIGWHTQRQGLPETVLTQTASIRSAQAHDVLPMKQGRKSIHKIFQEWGVPPFLRPHYPVVVAETGECLAVVGLAVNQRVAVANGLMPKCEQLGRFMLKYE